MRKAMNMFFIFLKNNLLNKSTYLMMILMLFACLCIKDYQRLSVNAPKNCGIFEESKNHFNDMLCEELSAKESFALYEDKNELLKDIENGTICCGFVVKSDIEDFDPDTYRGYSVEFISTSQIKEAETFKELFFDAFLKEYNDIIISSLSKELLQNDTPELEARIIEAKDMYLNSNDLFTVSIEYRKNDIDMSKPLVYPIRGIIATCIFLSVLLTGLSFYDEDRRALFKSMLMTERYKAQIVYLISAALPFSLTGYILQLIFDSRNSNLTDLPQMILLIVGSIIWTIILSKIAGSRKVYNSVVFAVIPLVFILCPIIINSAQYIQSIKYIKYLIPVSFYL